MLRTQCSRVHRAFIKASSWCRGLAWHEDWNFAVQGPSGQDGDADESAGDSLDAAIAAGGHP